MNAIFSARSDEESYSDYAKYAAITHNELLKTRWSFYEKSIIEKLTEDKTTSLVIADFGTSDGGNILPFLRKIIDFLKNRKFYGELTIVFNDLPGNNFDVLVKKVNDLKNKGIEIHMLMNACNMYERCLPKDTIDLGLSTYVLPILSRVNIEAGIGWNSATESERQMMKDQAAADWKQFLALRYEEMKIGGYLVLRFIEPGKFLKATEYMFLDLHKQGLIDKAELRNINFPVYHRTEDEIRAPFKDSTCTFNLRLVDINITEIQVSANHGTLVSSLPWIKNLLMSGLSPERDELYKDIILKELLGILETRCKGFPVDHVFQTMDVIVQKAE